jgi:signal transduction histidine kinase
VAVPSQVRVPRRYADALPDGRIIAIADDLARAYVRREVLYENLRVGHIYAALDIAPLLAERRSVLWTLILTNASLTLLLAGAAWLIVGRMMRPVRLLTDHLERSHSGQVAPIPDPVVASVPRDFRRPLAALNRLAAAVAEREALDSRLAEEERLASLGRLASGMAHEINNPLGGLFNAIDTLKRHGGDANVRRATIDLIQRGLEGIRDVVRAALMSYRAERDDRPLRPEDVEDLRLLIAPEARRRGVFLRWHNGLAGEAPLRAAAVRQITLNLIINACQATPRDGWVAVSLERTVEAIVIIVEDEGPGMPLEAKAMLTGGAEAPAPIGKGAGLGLWMTNRLVRELSGSATVEAGPAGGTRVTVCLPTVRKEELDHVA